MKFLKSYWWAILLLILGVWAYWFFMIKTDSTTGKKDPKKPAGARECDKRVSQAAFDTRVAEIEVDMRDDQPWSTSILSGKDSDETDDEAFLREATAFAMYVEGYCVNPAL